MLDQFKLNKHILLKKLSGGILRKVTLGRVLIIEPDLLLLDEPTNHLDIKTVKWLQKSLMNFTGSILFISHDRSFIQKVSTRIINLDRGKLISFPGDYKNFIRLKNQNNYIETVHKKIFDKHLEKEEKWLKRGIKARLTRNEGRIKNLKKLRSESNNYKKIEKLKDIQINESTKNYSKKIIFKLCNIDYVIDEKFVIKNFSSIVQSGDKIGIIGDNGCGKSTLIKILIKEIQPTQGIVYTGEKLKISYFDQNRLLLNPKKSILENISYGKENVLINGKEYHIIGYLKNFLFQPNQLNSLVKTLSGGECNRLLLARLFLKPSNVLILDEPTNDLDLDTLEMLEKIVINYKGTVLIVSHDSEFIKNTVNKCWVFNKNGCIDISLGHHVSIQKDDIYTKKHKKTRIKLNLIKKKKFQKELSQTLKIIEILERDIKNLQKETMNPNFFKKKSVEIIPLLKNIKQKEKELNEYFKIWEDIEAKIMYLKE